MKTPYGLGVLEQARKEDGVLVVRLDFDGSPYLVCMGTSYSCVGVHTTQIETNQPANTMSLPALPSSDAMQRQLNAHGKALKTLKGERSDLTATMQATRSSIEALHSVSESKNGADSDQPILFVRSLTRNADKWLTTKFFKTNTPSDLFVSARYLTSANVILEVNFGLMFTPFHFPCLRYLT